MDKSTTMEPVTVDERRWAGSFRTRSYRGDRERTASGNPLPGKFPNLGLTCDGQAGRLGSTGVGRKEERGE